MKLNYKRTIFVGFAFLLICMFWQAYDNIIPKILTDKFGMSQTWSGFIMALDNVFAVFLLPIFGALSDKKNTKLGRRTPYILIGTLCAAILFVGLSFTDNMQLTAIDDITATTDYNSSEHKTAMEVLYDSGVEIRGVNAEGEEVKARNTHRVHCDPSRSASLDGNFPLTCCCTHARRHPEAASLKG